MKTYVRDAFFSPKFSKCARYFSPKIYDARAIFRQFSDVKNGGRYQHPSVLGQLVSKEPQGTGISHLKES